MGAMPVVLWRSLVGTADRLGAWRSCSTVSTTAVPAGTKAGTACPAYSVARTIAGLQPLLMSLTNRLFFLR